MLFTSVIASSTFVASVFAVAELKPYILQRGAIPDISLNFATGLKRQENGYAPTHGPSCTGSGDTCESACGSTFLQCPSTDGGIHCFDTSIDQSCCSDGNGYACDSGYYCSSTASGDTWCCPEGMDLASCAALFSLTEPLQSVTTESVVASNTGAAPTSTPASTTASTSTTKSTSSYIAPTTPASKGNGTSGTATSTGAAQFTGGASINENIAGGAVGGIIMAVGAMFL